MCKRWGICSFLAIHFLVFGVMVLGPHSVVRGDVIAVGDTSPDPSTLGDAGGPVGGDLIIGVTDVGGLFMDIAPPLSGPLMPLMSANGIIGDGPDAIGAAVFDDFGVEWQIASELTIGDEGQGFLDVFESASIEVSTGPLGAGATFVGREATGYGEVTLNGAASRITTPELTVGNLGFGNVDVIDRGTLISDESYVGREDGSEGMVRLTGTGTRWDLRDVLTIANNGSSSPTAFGTATTANGTVSIELGALLQARSVSGQPAIKVGEFGFIELLDGTIRQLDIDDSGSALTALPILNGGVIRGDGFIDSALDIAPSGELRNAAAVASLRERLLVSGAVVNDGTIESLGGEMEFQAPVTNNLEIIARDAVMRFLNDPNGPGLDNFGALVLGGDTTLHGAVTMNPGSIVTVLPESSSLMIGDLTFTAASFMSLTVGDAPGTLDVVGATDITDSFLLLDYSAGTSSVPGDSYEVFSSTGGITGTFANTQAFTDGRFWDIVVGGSTVTVTATALLGVPFGADFNGDGIVDATDLGIWTANFGTTGPPGFLDTLGDADGDGDVDGADFLKIQMDLGGPPSLVAAVATVPEPSTLVLALTAVGLCYRRRAAI